MSEMSCQVVRPSTRRKFLARYSLALGTAAFAKLLEGETPSAQAAARAEFADPKRSGGLPGLPHFAPRAKRVIYLFMAGGPSHIDLFDYKPVLRKIDGQPLPDGVRGEQRLTTMTSRQGKFLCVAPKFSFERRGERGTWINTDLLPYMWTT